MLANEKYISENNIDYFKEYVDPETEKQEFLKTLYHDHNRPHPGKAFRVILEKDEDSDQNTRIFSSNNLDKIIDFKNELKAFKKPSIYVTVNEFKSIKRTTENLYALNAMYIDLDCHDYESDIELFKIKENTKKVLNAAYNFGELLPPTMLVSTGRGFGLYYVLDRSIANLDSLKKTKDAFKIIYNNLLKKYDELLKKYDDVLEIDFKVKDVTRICRVPGTYNYSANIFCHLFKTKHNFYNITDIKKKCHLEKFDKKVSKKGISSTLKNDKNYKIKSDKKTTVYNLENFKTETLMKSRVEIFEKVVDLKKKQEIEKGYRETLCFFMYNSLVQIVDRAEAKEIVLDFCDENFGEDNNLKKRVIQDAFKAVDNNKTDNYAGFYKFRNYQIAEKLSLSKEDCKEIGLGFSMRREQREQSKKDTAEKKSKRNELVLKLKQENPQLTQVALLEKVNQELEKQISLRTLKTILKDANLTKKNFSAAKIKNVVKDSQVDVEKKECDEKNIYEIIDAFENGMIDVESIVYSNEKDDDIFDFSNLDYAINNELQLIEPEKEIKKSEKKEPKKEIKKSEKKEPKKDKYEHITYCTYEEEIESYNIEHLAALEKWCELKNLLKEYNQIDKMRRENPSARLSCNVQNFIKELSYTRKSRKIEKFLAEITEEIVTYEDLDKIVMKHFNESIVTYKAPKRTYSKEQKDVFKRFTGSKDFWIWLKETSSDVKIRRIKAVYRKKYFDFKNENKIHLYNKKMYMSDVLKSKILFRITKEDIINIANLKDYNNDDEIIDEMINLIEKRYEKDFSCKKMRVI